MPDNTTLLLYLPAAALALVLPNLFNMSTTPPSKEKPWADGPCPLIKTPQYATGNSDIWTIGATHMAHIHNAILRGYNSIYHQALHIPLDAKPDFIGYSLSWYRFVKSHHDDEENELFPKVEEMLGQKGIWDETHKEHESFLDGLGKFGAYLEGLAEPYDFDGKELLRIMSTFQDPFNAHFHNEIATITSFSALSSSKSLSPSDLEAAATIFKVWGKKTVTKAGTTDVVPFFLLNLDRTYEERMWKDWPPMPKAVRWGLVNVAGAWNWGWWKFASCDAGGRPRELWALEFPVYERGR